MEPTPVQFAVDKRRWGTQKNWEKKWMRRERRVVLKAPSTSELSNPTALINVASLVGVVSMHGACVQGDALPVAGFNLLAAQAGDLL